MDDVRPATAAEVDAAHALGMDPRVYATWIDAGFSPEDVGQWYPVTRTRGTGPDTAVRLREAGVSPTTWWAAVDQVVRARGYLTQSTAAGCADAAVLWDDVARHLLACADAVKLIRNDAVHAARALGYSSDLLAQRLRISAEVLELLPHPWRTPGH